MFAVMAYEPSPEAIVLARRARAAVKRAGFLVKQAADHLGVSYKTLDDMLSARRPLVSRIWGLENFDLAMAEVIADERDAFLIQKRQVLLIEVEATPKRMAKASLADMAEKEIA